MEFPFHKDDTPNFAKPEVRQAYLNGAEGADDLLRKELDINQAEQVLLQQRIDLVKDFVNTMPDSDPQYSLLLVQVQMDQVELDELKRRAESLTERLR